MVDMVDIVPNRNIKGGVLDALFPISGSAADSSSPSFTSPAEPKSSKGDAKVKIDKTPTAKAQTAKDVGYGGDITTTTTAAVSTKPATIRATTTTTTTTAQKRSSLNFRRGKNMDELLSRRVRLNFGEGLISHVSGPGKNPRKGKIELDSNGVDVFDRRTNVELARSKFDTLDDFVTGDGKGIKATNDDDDDDDDEFPDLGADKTISGKKNYGRWHSDEHALFLEGLKEYGKKWGKIATRVQTRTRDQTRTHAQKYFVNLFKRQGGKMPDEFGTRKDVVASPLKMADSPFSNGASVTPPTARNGATPDMPKESGAITIFVPSSDDEAAASSTETITTTSSKIILTYTCCDGTELQLKSKDVARLRDGEMLNDTLIDFYFLHLRDKLQQESLAISNRTYIFSSYFYDKLTCEGYNFDNVKNWTKNVRIHNDFDVLVVPVHGSLHWSLALVVRGDDEYEILHLDALRMHNYNLISRNLKRFLADVYLHEQKTAKTTNAVVDTEAEEETLTVIRKCRNADAYSANVPIQPNDTDCGMYVCTYASNFFQEWSASADLKKGLHKLAHALREGDKKDWFDHSYMRSVRRGMKSQIHALVAQKKKKKKKRNRNYLGTHNNEGAYWARAGRRRRRRRRRKRY